ncbi:TIGR04283 family arsenosugar biosynthesis glycosyltransferase [Winogradskyella immobilis]|uniref:TIGR04283 family arsenosugar biosynthesis glycosyltransferase n=1 Tax=Winogradskyella immobilis TaxID=2816852 RepID=A0ABS8EJD5_9FLAO|nr:TIGR04283 family arsenosugar biosynthesis glycosyltransferase [Winogradskyella immobilis]MCC1483141.1 TIGR04283 family arsenosugar biosynthesis glycosyltransferase [Winogradskyella immobilis]MCG0015236.1 TIGR04283 family arsenosugar biosynthesis glycosyltransferase [Winogradskyella immobilis]
MNHQLSIIIPIFNEAEIIGDLLKHLITHSETNLIKEILVVDGGSTDTSSSIVNHFISESKEIPVRILTSEKGRAKQMNFGAQHAKGEILYFLHADSFPPKGYDQYIINEIKKRNFAGCFRLQFDHKHWWLRIASWFTQFSWRACRGGDQSQFITKSLFKDIGGFDEAYIIYEDNILINELYSRKEFVVINKKIRTSARLYKKHGIWKLQYHFLAIYVKRWLGASAEELYAYYKKNIC